MNAQLLRGLRWGLLVAAVLLIALGVARGEALTVLEKATNICTDCIGIR